MENFQGNYSRATKIKLPSEMKAQRLMIGDDRHRGGSVSSTTFDSDNVGLNAPILRYLCGGGGSPTTGKLAPRGSRSPLSAVENSIDRFAPSSPTAFRTPVKAVEGEEVLVMDGLPLRRNSRFSGSESSGSSGKNLFKAEIVQSSEDSGDFLYSPKFQFSRTREDFRPNRLAIKNKTELQVNNSNDGSPGLFTYSPDALLSLPQTLSPTFSEAAVTPTRTSSPAEPTTQARSVSPTATMRPNHNGSRRPQWAQNRAASPTTPRPHNRTVSTRPSYAPNPMPSPHPLYQPIPYLVQIIPPSPPFPPPPPPAPFTPIRLRIPEPPVPRSAVPVTSRPSNSNKRQTASTTAPIVAIPATTSRNTEPTLIAAEAFVDWLPQDDGIVATQPRERTNAHINLALYSGLCTHRLPVFSVICPDSEDI